jgi:hypothetical protein
MKRYLLVVVLVALLLLAWIGVIFAADPVMSRLFESLTGLGQTQQARLVRESNISQTRDGVTVTVQQVYADSNQIVIGFKVTSVDGQRYSFGGAQLKDGAGNNLLGVIGTGYNGPSNTPGLNLPAGEGVEVFAFDASRIQGTPSQIDLHLTLMLHALPPTLGHEVGPFTFDLTAPFNPGRAIEIQKTVTNAGIDVTLERIIVTPSGARAHICYGLPTRDRSWTLIANLDIGDGRTQSAGLVRPPTRIGEICDRVYFRDARPEQFGVWTLTVTELVAGPPPTQPGEAMRVSGPWAFQFNVP